MRANPVGIRLFKKPAIVSSTWDPSVLTLNRRFEVNTATMFTDLGTTHVASDGDLIRQWNDASGNGWKVDDGGSGSGVRPLYKVGPKPYAKFDGIDDGLQSSAHAYLDGTGQGWVAVAVSFDAVASFQIASALLGLSNNEAYVGVLATAVARAGSGRSDGIYNVDDGGTLTANTPVVLIAQSTDTSVEVFVNNVSGGATTFAGGARETSNALFYMGNHGGSNFAACKMYGVIGGPGLLGSTDRGLLNTYMTGLYT
jgi:hypothetical protein